MENNFQNLKTVIIGDSRAAGYGICLKNFVNILEVVSYPFTRHQKILEFVENYLIKFDPHLLILVTLLDDIIELSEDRKLYGSRDTFCPSTALESCKYYSDKWSLQYPNLYIIWTVPDIPDLVKFNNIREKTSVSDWLRREEKLIFQFLQKFKDNFSFTVGSEKRFLINLRMFIIDEDIEEKLLAYMCSHSHKTDQFYTDGVNPNSSLSQLFADQLVKLIIEKNIRICVTPAKIQCFSKDEDIKFQGTLAGDIIKKLWKRHQRVNGDYMECPQSYPGHDLEKGKFMEAKAKEMVLNNKYPSAEELAKEWSLFWYDAMTKDLEESWVKKKLECLSLLNIDTFDKKSFDTHSSKRKEKEPNKKESSISESEQRINGSEAYHSTSNNSKLKRKYEDTYNQAGPSSTIQYISNSRDDHSFTSYNSNKSKDGQYLHSLLYSLLSSSQFLGQHYFVIKTMINETLDYKTTGLTDKMLLTSDSLKIFKEVQYELKQAYSSTTSIAYHDTINLKSNISIIDELIQYCTYMLPSSYRYPSSNVASKDNKNECSSNYKYDSFSLKTFNSQSMNLKTHSIEYLISKVGQYNTLSLIEQVELDFAIEDIRKRDKELAVSLSVLKKQSFD